MPATEIVTTVVGTYAGKEVHAPTGWKGQTFSGVHDWVAGKRTAGITVRDVSSSVLVKGASQWAAYEEKVGSDTLLTIFEVTP
jgi:hypothetical protein